ncbi:hypothetical protein [Leptospira santarosai]|uniref:hypothetical protein n=1 Tax=Leptospira santarosai TaxID=28183 RepID=UPI0007747CEF|nr:hypothetical protein [Leptospira santarosai]
MILKTQYPQVKLIAFFLLGLLILDCLPYRKVSKVTDEKILRREFEKTESKINVTYSLGEKKVIFVISESQLSKENIKKEKVVSTKRELDLDQKACVEIERSYKYWDCMLLPPLLLLGIPYIITVPIIIYDWSTYPIYTFSEDKQTEIADEIVTSEAKEVIPQNIKLKLTNEELKFSRTYSVKEGKVEVPFNDLNVNYLWNSGEEKVGKQFQYYYSVLDSKSKVILPATAFKGTEFHDDQDFTNLSNERYWLDKEKEFPKCLKRFPSKLLNEATYVKENNHYLADTSIYDKIVIKACGSQLSADMMSCVNYFDECVSVNIRINDKK